jgi:hypothetical protein
MLVLMRGQELADEGCSQGIRSIHKPPSWFEATFWNRMTAVPSRNSFSRLDHFGKTRAS